MWTDELSVAESEFARVAIKALSGVPWAEPLLKRNGAEGLTSKNMPFLFEVRLAYELHRHGRVADYEYATGIGDSCVDFRLCDDTEWLIEAVSIRASVAVKRATRQRGMIYEQMLSTTSSDPAQTEEAEMITVQQKIVEKVFSKGAPTKFPIPHNAFHIIIADMRGYLDQGGDIFDYRQMAYGAKGIPKDQSWRIHYWNALPGNLEPIKGLFEENNPLRGAPFMRERVHFLGFVRESVYREGEIPEVGYYLANPHLFPTQEAATHAFATYPLSLPSKYP